MAINFGNDSITQYPDTGTIPNWQQPSTSDPKAKKCVTENELGLMTMWAWGASISSLSTTHCPEYEDIYREQFMTSIPNQKVEIIKTDTRIPDCIEKPHQYMVFW